MALIPGSITIHSLENVVLDLSRAQLPFMLLASLGDRCAFVPMLQTKKPKKLSEIQ